MIESYTEGFLLGIGAAMPLGPINILIMNNALKSYKSGVTIGLGAMSADTFYLTLILVGMIGFINNPSYLSVIGVVGSIFLLYLSYDIFKNRAKKVDVKEQKIQTKNLLKKYTQGLFLTLLNPMTIIFWFSIAGYVASKGLNTGFTIFGLMSSIFLWITIMPYLIHRSKHKISQKVSKYLSVFSSVILFWFAVSLLVEVMFF